MSERDSINIQVPDLGADDAHTLKEALEVENKSQTGGTPDQVSITEVGMDGTDGILDSLSPWQTGAQVAVEFSLEVANQVPPAVIATYVCEKLSTHNTNEITVNGETVPISKEEIQNIIQRE